MQAPKKEHERNLKGNSPRLDKTLGKALKLKTPRKTRDRSCAFYERQARVEEEDPPQL